MTAPLRALKRPAAGKTGTTNDFRNAWFAGFTPQIAASVWVGFDDQSTSLGNGQNGALTALPIWAPFMKMAHDFGIAPIPEKKIVTRHLPGSGQYTVDVSLTLDAGAPDQALQATKGATALRRARIKRIVKEGNIHGNLISIKYLAQLFRVNPRTIQRDLRIIAKEFPEEEK